MKWILITKDNSPPKRVGVLACNRGDMWWGDCFIGEDGKWYNTWDDDNPPAPCYPSHYLEVKLPKPKEEVVAFFKNHTERETVERFNLKSARCIYRWKKELSNK